MRNTFPILIIFFILASVFSIGCVDDSAEQEAVFKTAVDTIFNRRINQFNKDLDSICATQKDSIILRNMDSIKTLRLKEIEKLIQK